MFGSCDLNPKISTTKKCNSLQGFHRHCFKTLLFITVGCMCVLPSRLRKTGVYTCHFDIMCNVYLSAIILRTE